MGMGNKKKVQDIEKPRRARDILQPNLTVDALVLDGKGRLLLVERGKEPYKGRYALPGGFVEYGETVESAVVRELLEETGLRACSVELFGVYSDPSRDPRGHTVSVVFAVRTIDCQASAGDDAANTKFFSIDELPQLAFDHEKIVSDFLSSKKRKKR